MILPDSFAGRRVALLGLGRAHKALALALKAEGAEVLAFDREQGKDDVLRELGIAGTCGDGYLGAALGARLDFCFLTPGMRKDLPEVRALVEGGCQLAAEAGYFLARRKAPVLGITGSAGKTTTTTLVARMLARSGVAATACGNIGRAFADALRDEGRTDIYVAELSSFQLQLVEESPEIAAVLNIRPNHLDIHPSFTDYAQSKWRIARYQGPEDLLVLPPELLADAQGEGGRATFSLTEEADATFRDGQLTLYGEPLMAARDVRLPGRHNLENALAAALLAQAGGARPEDIREELRNFSGVPHRLELVADAGGVRFINDSIATAPDRTLAAFGAIQGPLLWLGGGYDKHLDYGVMRGHLGDVRRAFLFGPVGRLLLPVCRDQGVPAELYPDFAAAVAAAMRAAQPGDTVLLSPGAASYDAFRDFEQRGEAFRKLVQDGLAAN